MRNDIPLTVIGNLVEDPELRFTPNGVPMVRFTIASTPRTFDREADAWKDGEPTFLDCTAWRQLAENLAASARKGARLVVAGRLRTERWETPEGEKRSKMVMDADEVAASMTFATVAITRTPRAAPPPATAPDDPWATASPTRPAPPAGTDAPHEQEPPF
ncbi:single-stranded DNA-binding protein [Streptomyces sp. NPDC005574]|uniref:single-stranded DNA-binding protein n=1 Tax=Streptomyces sp. NPDC005574 TaxID=3156891 RepID=UPI0033B26B75